MSDQRTNIEVIALTIEEAIEKGLADLGLVEDDVDVEILDPGSRGLFGLGSRQARVRLTIRGVSAETSPADLDREEESELEIEAEFASGSGYAAVTQADLDDEPVELDEEQEQVLRVCSSVVADLLEKMKVRAKVKARYNEPEDDRSKSPVWVDVMGNDLSILIGPRAETLNALQYIAGLIISKELGRTVPLVVDVEGFRSRRIQQLRQLARRMADQAAKTGRRQVLEPMPASERRIVHIELRSNPLVTTESIGEEPHRKVTINPK